MTFCSIFNIITLAAHERRKKFPDSSMVEHSTVNRVVVSSSLTRGAKWPDGQAVKTPPFHGGIGGSIPPPVTTSFGRLAQLGERLPYKQNVSSSILLAPTTKEDDTCVTLYRLFYFVFLVRRLIPCGTGSRAGPLAKPSTR